MASVNQDRIAWDSKTTVEGVLQSVINSDQLDHLQCCHVTHRKPDLIRKLSPFIDILRKAAIHQTDTNTSALKSSAGNGYLSFPRAVNKQVEIAICASIQYYIDQTHY